MTTTRSALTLLSATLALASFLVGCSSDSTVTDAGGDSGTDSGARVDAGRDAGISNDGGPTDTGSADVGSADTGVDASADAGPSADLGVDAGANDAGPQNDGGVLSGPITRRVSIHTNGAEANAHVWGVDVSGDGRYVVFHSDSTTLVDEDTDALADIFVHDTVQETTTLVSVSSLGIKGDSTSRNPKISPDGRFVAFESNATNLVADDDNNREDVFLRDLLMRTTVRVSPNSGHRASRVASVSNDGRFVAYYTSNEVLADGTDIIVWDATDGSRITASVLTGGGDADLAPSLNAISGNGRFVVFQGSAADLIETDPSLASTQVMMHDLMTRTTVVVSSGVNGVLANGACNDPKISDDGRYISFYSAATNLVPNDTNNATDVFVYDVQDDVMTRVSVDSSGVQGNAGSSVSSLSADGRIIAFQSSASNLVAGDENGVDDIFLHNLDTGVTTRVSPPAGAAEADGASYEPSLCPGANCVVYRSLATNLIVGDTNALIDAYLSIVP